MQIAILLFDRFTCLDAIGPYQVLSGVPGAEVSFVAERPGPIRDEEGSLVVTAPAGLPGRAEILGPIPVEGAGGVRGERPAEASRALIRIGRGDGLELARALHAVQATRSARKDGGAIRVQLDPAEVA